MTAMERIEQLEQRLQKLEELLVQFAEKPATIVHYHYSQAPYSQPWHGVIPPWTPTYGPNPDYISRLEGRVKSLGCIKKTREVTV